MPYPNDNRLNIIVAQTSASADGTGKFPFTEKIISGSGLILQTDSQGNLIGSTGIAVSGDITASNISASGWITASNILDNGNLTVLGDTRLGDSLTDSTSITGSVRISGSLTVQGPIVGNVETASKVLVSNIDTTNSTYYVTFVANTGSAQSISTDSSILSYNPGTNVLTVGVAASGSVVVGNNITMQDNAGSSQLRVGIVSTDTASLLVSANAFQVVKGTGATDRVSTNLPLSASNDVLFSSTTQATSWDNGALKITGGVGIGKNLYVSGSLNALGNSVIGNETAETVQITASLSLSGSTSTNSSSFSDLTANRVVYTDGNKILSTDADLTFDGTTLTANTVDINGGAIDGTVIGGTISSSGTFTTLTATGNTILGDATSDIIRMTGSVSISGSLTIEGTLNATSSLASTASTVFITDTSTGTGPYYVTFVDGTSGAKAVRTDSSTLTWNATTNTLSSSGNFIANTVTASLSGSIIQTGNVTINGGAINNTTIGLTTPSTGNFTNLSASNVLITSSLSFVELMSTGSSLSNGLGINISASATTGSNTVVQLISSVSTGSSYALVIDSTSGVSGLAFAISASRGQIVGTLFTGSNALFTNLNATTITSSLSGSSVSTGNATINGGTINNTVIGGTISASGTFTNLTATGNTLLGDATSDSIKVTGSMSISGSLSVVGSIAGTIETASKVTVTNLPNSQTTYYVTFVSNTGSAQSIVTDSDILSYSPSANAIAVGSTSGSINIGSGPGQITLTNLYGSSSLLTVGSILSNQTSSFSVGNTSTGNNFQVSIGAGDDKVSTNIPLSASNNVLFSSTTQATNFSNGALHVDGGVSISKNLYVSGSTFLAGDLTIYGSSSIVNISSSTLIIGDNRILLNAGNPIIRYAGIDVYDSGSGGIQSNVTSSFLWDSQTDTWIIFSANSSSNAPLTSSSAIMVGGPVSQFGSEATLTTNVIPKVQSSGKNITNSALSDDGTTLLYSGTRISASQFTASNVLFPNVYTTNISASRITASNALLTNVYSTTISSSLISASNLRIDLTGSITYATGVLVTYVTGSFNTLTLTTGSFPGNAPGLVPNAPTSSGMPGQINVDNNFIYVYTNNIWKRVPLSQWSN